MGLLRFPTTLPRTIRYIITSKKPKTAAIRRFPFTNSIVLNVPIETSVILAKKINKACTNTDIISPTFTKY